MARSRKVFTTRQIADALGGETSTRWARRWLKRNGLLRQIDTDTAGRPLYGTTILLLQATFPDVWDAVSLDLMDS